MLINKLNEDTEKLKAKPMQGNYSRQILSPTSSRRGHGVTIQARADIRFDWLGKVI